VGIHQYRSAADDHDPRLARSSFSTSRTHRQQAKAWQPHTSAKPPCTVSITNRSGCLKRTYIHRRSDSTCASNRHTLRASAPHVRLPRPASGGNEKRGDLVHHQDQQLDIKWGKVIWITTRDQVLAPMFQGMIWSVSPLLMRAPSNLTAFCIFVTVAICRGILSPWVQYFRRGSVPSSKNGRPSRTGAGIAKLKSWLSAIIPPTPAASFRTR
jgi:hypothetical protein